MPEQNTKWKLKIGHRNQIFTAEKNAAENSKNFKTEF